MNKRAIAILGAIFILIVGALGFLIYQRQHRNNTDQTQQTNTDQQNTDNETPSDQTPTDQQPNPADNPPKAVKLGNDEVVGPILFYQGNGVTYFNSQGQLFQNDLGINGSDVSLSNKRELTIALKSGISKILWPQSGNNFIAQLGTGASRRWSFYDSTKGSYIDLPAEVKAVNWLPSSDKIMLVYVDNTGKASLNMANPDGSGYQTVTGLYEADDDMSVSPDGKSILFWRTQNREARNIISFLSPDGKVYKSVVNDGYNMGVKWSPDSQKFVFAKRNPQTQEYGLWLADLNSGQTTDLDINTTPDKVVWTKSSGFIYAAVPTKGSATSGSLTQDTIIKITISTGEKQEFNPGITVDARDLFLDNSENNLFFKNEQDRALYYINLQP